MRKQPTTRAELQDSPDFSQKVLEQFAVNSKFDSDLLDRQNFMTGHTEKKSKSFLARGKKDSHSKNSLKSKMANLPTVTTNRIQHQSSDYAPVMMDSTSNFPRDLASSRYEDPQQLESFMRSQNKFESQSLASMYNNPSMSNSQRNPNFKILFRNNYEKMRNMAIKMGYVQVDQAAEHFSRTQTNSIHNQSSYPAPTQIGLPKHLNSNGRYSKLEGQLKPLYNPTTESSQANISSHIFVPHFDRSVFGHSKKGQQRVQSQIEMQAVGPSGEGNGLDQIRQRFSHIANDLKSKRESQVSMSHSLNPQLSKRQGRNHQMVAESFDGMLSKRDHSKLQMAKFESLNTNSRYNRNYNLSTNQTHKHHSISLLEDGSPPLTNRKMKELMIAAGGSEIGSDDMSHLSLPNKTLHEVQLKQIKFNKQNISKAMQKRLEASQCAIFVEGQTPQNKLLQEYQDLCKNVNLNLKEELNFHRQALSELKEFKDLQFTYDHAFVKNIIGSIIRKEKMKEELGTDNVVVSQKELDRDSIALNTSGFDINSIGETRLEQSTDILPNSSTQEGSFLSPEQEKLLSDGPVTVNQNKKLVALWLQAKNQLQEEQKKVASMTTEALNEHARLEPLAKFLEESTLLIQNFTKIMINEEGNIMSALIVDQVFKTLLLKIDSVFHLKLKEIQEFRRDCDRQIATAQDNCKAEIELMEKRIDIERGILDQKTIHLKDQIESQRRQMDKMKAKIDTQREELSMLTSYDARFSNIRDLQHSFQGLNDMINEHQFSRKYQIRLIDEYTKMIDVGIAKKTRANQHLQTNLSLANQANYKFSGVQTRKKISRNIEQFMTYKSDSEVLEAFFDPVQSVIQVTDAGEQQIDHTYYHRFSDFRQLYHFAEKILDGKDPNKADNFKIDVHNEGFNQHGSTTLSKRNTFLLPHDVIHNKGLGHLAHYIPTRQLFQLQIFNFLMREHQDELRESKPSLINSSDMVVIRNRCLALMQAISKHSSKGLLYANTLAIIFGFRHVENQSKLVAFFLKERAKYHKYFLNEPPENKTVKQPPVTSPTKVVKRKTSLRKNQRRKSNLKGLDPDSLMSKDETLISNSSDRDDITDTDESFSGDETSRSFKFKMGEEHQSSLSLVRVIDYINHHFKSTTQTGDKSSFYFNGIGLGHRILNRLFGSLEGRHTKFFPKISHVKINKIYTSNDVPINKQGKEGLADLSIDEIRSLIKRKMEPSTLSRFSKVMVSLYGQSGQKPFDIMNYLKNYEAVKRFGFENYTPNHFVDALTKEGSFWISSEDVEAVFQFMDPLGYLTLSQDQSTSSLGEDPITIHSSSPELAQKPKEFNKDKLPPIDSASNSENEADPVEPVSPVRMSNPSMILKRSLTKQQQAMLNQKLPVKQFTDLFSSHALSNFMQYAYVNSSAVNYAILEGHRDFIKDQTVRLSGFLQKYAAANLDKIRASRERQYKLEEKKREGQPKKQSRKPSNAHSPISSQRKMSKHLKAPPKQGELSISIQRTEGFESLDRSKRDTIEEPSLSDDSELDSLQAMRVAIDSYGLFDFYSEFKHLSNCLQVCAKDYSMHQRAAVFRKFMLEVTCSGEERLKDSEVECCKVLAEKVVEASDDIHQIIHLHFQLPQQ